MIIPAVPPKADRRVFGEHGHPSVRSAVPALRCPLCGHLPSKGEKSSLEEPVPRKREGLRWVSVQRVKSMTRRQIISYNPKLKERTGELRKNMTKAEVRLWVHIRKKQIANLQFYRQRPIGNYIVDFYCPDAKLVIEVDGGQHFDDEGLEYDEIRDAFLEGQGLKVLRFTNLDVMQNIESVVFMIEHEIGQSQP